MGVRRICFSRCALWVLDEFAFPGLHVRNVPRFTSIRMTLLVIRVWLFSILLSPWFSVRVVM